MPSEENTSPELTLEIKLEALLFSAPGPVNLGQLAQSLVITTRAVEKGLESLDRFYEDRGLRVQRHRGRVQLTTAPEIAGLIETFLGLEATSRLSFAALEALAIIAYQQPVTRPQIDAIRGVNSDSVLKNLLTKGLVQESGRAPGPGRPILYETTTEFLQHFGLNHLDELPPLIVEPEPTSPNGEPGEVDQEPAENDVDRSAADGTETP
jgi:segregation and condensation protein B